MPSTLSADRELGIAMEPARRQPQHIVTSAWLEHAPFAFWLTETMRPRMFVELGTHFGFSYFAICQAVQELGLDTRCFAVDTWLGDEHASRYGEDVHQSVEAHNGRYSSFSTLVRSTFDEALPRFADGSVDLLHVDGRHFYDDVKHDFESWLPKLADNAIVLFHDTQVHERDFGVWKYFGEIRERYPAFEFTHCNGLGVIAIKQVPAALAPLFDANPAKANEIRAAFAALGVPISARWKAIRKLNRAARRKAQGPWWRRLAAKLPRGTLNQ